MEGRLKSRTRMPAIRNEAVARYELDAMLLEENMEQTAVVIAGLICSGLSTWNENGGRVWRSQRGSKIEVHRE